jgi:hypothetical protein
MKRTQRYEIQQQGIKAPGQTGKEGRDNKGDQFVSIHILADAHGPIMEWTLFSILR